jgi:integrase
MANLRLQGSIYHARLTIPKDVRPMFGNRSEFSQSLGTGKKAQANEKAIPIIAAWKQMIRLVRDGEPPTNISDFRKAWAKEMSNADDSDGRLIRIFGSNFGESPAWHELREPSGKEQAEAVLYDTLDELVEKGDFPEDALAETLAIVRGEKVILADHKEDYLRQFATNAPKTKSAYSAALDHFLERFKEDKQVTSKQLKLWLLELADEKQLSKETITRILKQASSFWSYLHELEIIRRDTNPFTQFKLSIPRTARQTSSYKDFDPQEIVGLLNEPKCKGDPQLSLLINLAMYTGARIEELAKLESKDLNLDLDVINLRGTKSEKSKLRIIPLHPVLKKMLAGPLPGFIHDGYVIPGLAINKGGLRGTAMGKRFGRLKTDSGFADRSYCFHSIRKTVCTMLDRAGVAEGITADIVGHEKQTITYGLYSGGSSLQQKRDAILKLCYPPFQPSGHDFPAK